MAVSSKTTSSDVTHKSFARRVWQTAAAIKTGVVLLILVVILAAAGTIILQRPMTDPDDMQRAYSPQALRLLDATGHDRRVSCVVVSWVDGPGQRVHYCRFD